MNPFDFVLSTGLAVWRRFGGRCRRWWYGKSFSLSAKRIGSDISISPDNTFDVPVRSDGTGSINIGAKNVFGYAQTVRLGTGEILIQPRTPTSKIVIGQGNWFSNNVAIVATQEVVIGNGCQIGDMVTIYDTDFHEINPKTRNRSAGNASPVSIGDNVWLGSRVMILKGVTIGDNSVVGPMSVVSKSIPANSLAVGAPACVIRQIGENDSE